MTPDAVQVAREAEATESGVAMTLAKVPCIRHLDARDYNQLAGAVLGYAKSIAARVDAEWRARVEGAKRSHSEHCPRADNITHNCLCGVFTLNAGLQGIIDRADRYRAALVKYGEHLSGCLGASGDAHTCTCGLDAATEDA